MTAMRTANAVPQLAKDTAGRQWSSNIYPCCFENSSKTPPTSAWWTAVRTPKVN